MKKLFVLYSIYYSENSEHKGIHKFFLARDKKEAFYVADRVTRLALEYDKEHQLFNKEAYKNRQLTLEQVIENCGNERDESLYRGDNLHNLRYGYGINVFRWEELSTHPTKEILEFLKAINLLIEGNE